MEERGVGVGELSGRTGIDTVTLVSILFGLEEVRAVEWTRLSEALDISPDGLVEGHRLVSAREGAGGLSDDDARTCDHRPSGGAER